MLSCQAAAGVTVRSKLRVVIGEYFTIAKAHKLDEFLDKRTWV
jgi:hypothetical protein